MCSWFSHKMERKMFQREVKEKRKFFYFSVFFPIQCLLFTGIQIFSIVVIFTPKMDVSLLQRCELILEVK